MGDSKKTGGGLAVFWGRSKRGSGRKRTGQYQRYCRRCRVELRPGSRFCASCWKPTDYGKSEFYAKREARARRAELGGRPGPPGAAWGKRASDTSTSRGGRVQNLYRRFQALPFTSKVVYVGLPVIGLLVILSPLTFWAGVVSSAVSTTAAIIRAVNRRPWKRLAIVAVVAVLLTLAAGGISNIHYSAAFSEGKVQLSEEDQRYVEQVGGIQEAMRQRLNDNAQILKKYPGISPPERERIYDHYFSDRDLKKTAEEEVKVPTGCEDHYEIWLESMDKATNALYTDATLLDTLLVPTKALYQSSADELRGETDASFEKADKLLNQIRGKGCQR